MALEQTTTLGGGDDDSLQKDREAMERRLWAAAPLTLTLIAIAMAPMFTDSTAACSPWLQAGLATPVVWWAGWPVLLRGAQSLRHRSLNMFTLIGTGVITAYGFSLIATIAPDIVPAAFHAPGHGVSLYYEAAAAIVTLTLVGQVLELRARQSTGSALRELASAVPTTACRIGDSGDEVVAWASIQPGDRLRVRPGDRFPVDGVVEEGESTADESMVTGEAMPVAKQPGDDVVGGTLNRDGAVVMRAQKVGADTFLAHVVAMVSEAQKSRAPIQRTADRVSAWFVPGVLAAAAITFALWAAFGPAPQLAHGLTAAVSVVIIACPCALGLATPMSIAVATGTAARCGILFRNAESLQRLAEADALFFDKTGTLTVGRPHVVTVVGDESALAMAAALEQHSEHPLGRALVEYARRQNTKAAHDVEGFRAHPGRGASGRVDGIVFAVGNARLMDELGIATGSWGERAQGIGAAFFYVARDGDIVAAVGVADALKPDARPALQSLRRAGLTAAMLTGDRRDVALSVAKEVGIDDVHAELLPADKDRVVADHQRAGHCVVFAGDGINDGPALARADVGVAMGTGAGVATQAGSVILVNGDLTGLYRARLLSRRTMSNVRQNLFFAFAYNALGIPVAAGALYPLVGILLAPAMAAAAMSMSSVCVIANALRLRAQPSELRLV